jgi:hypothetical protein
MTDFNCDNIYFKCKMNALLLKLRNDRQKGQLGSVGPATFSELEPFLAAAITTKEQLQYSFRFHKREKSVIAIGDIHGDFLALLSALYLGAVIDEHGFWVGEDAMVVQLGDIMDRGGRGVTENTSNNQREEIDILQYLHALDAQARKTNGRVVSLVGNHEAEQFTNPSTRVTKYETSFLTQGWGGIAAKRRWFQPNSQLAKFFCLFKPLIVTVNDYIFCHGGLVPSMFQPGDSIASLNQQWTSFLSGRTPDVPERIREVYWNRDLSLPKATSRSANDSCVLLVNALFDRLQIPRQTGGIVVAHTVQQDGIPIYCAGKVWRVDVALSEAFGRRVSPIEILRIRFNARDWSRKTVVQVIKGLQSKRRTQREIHNFVRGDLTWVETQTTL